jgi:hypothetical protein
MILASLDEATGQQVKTTRDVTINAARLAFFHETPNGPVHLSMDGGQVLPVKNPLAELVGQLRLLAGIRLARFVLAGDDRLVAHLVREKINFIVPNPDNSTSIQIGGGTVLHVSEPSHNVTHTLSIA